MFLLNVPNNPIIIIFIQIRKQTPEKPSNLPKVTQQWEQRLVAKPMLLSTGLSGHGPSPAPYQPPPGHIVATAPVRVLLTSFQVQLQYWCNSVGIKNERALVHKAGGHVFLLSMPSLRSSCCLCIEGRVLWGTGIRGVCVQTCRDARSPTTHPMGHMHPTQPFPPLCPGPPPGTKVAAVLGWGRDVGS